MRSTTLLLVYVLGLNVSALRPALGVPEADQTDSQEAIPQKTLAAYLDRLASTPPREADAHVVLAKWCLEQGLAAEARRAFEEALAIDADCPEARAALGYVRYGTGWRHEDAASRRRAPPRARVTRDAGRGREPGSAGAAGSEPSARTETIVRPERPAVEEGDTVTGTTDPIRVVDRVEQKKNWAAEAAEKLGIAFVTYEDRDFLVHSTFSTRDRQFKRLLDYLKGLKRLVSSALGLRSRTVIWPDKLQIVLLRSEPEYERFALHVDGLESVRNPEGAYTRGDHTVLWNADSEALARVIGRTSLDQLYDSDRPVGPWLRDGIAELVLAGSPWGAARDYGEEAFVDAAEALREETGNAMIFELLETGLGRERGSRKGAILAMTLTQFLIKSSRRGFTELVRELKSDEAPPPPAAEEDLDAYILDYVSFQEKALNEHFGASVTVLGERWKDYVVRTGTKLEKEREERETQRREAERGIWRRPRRG